MLAGVFVLGLSDTVIVGAESCFVRRRSALDDDLVEFFSTPSPLATGSRLGDR